MATIIKRKVKTNNKLEQLQKYIKCIAILKDIKLSGTETVAIAHFMIEGYNDVSKDSLMFQGIVKDRHLLGNLLHKMRGKGILVKALNKEQLCPEFLIKLEEAVLLMIMLDNR
jgi:hypothetical protein